jgi:hypothetical protein
MILKRLVLMTRSPMARRRLNSAAASLWRRAYTCNTTQQGFSLFSIRILKSNGDFSEGFLETQEGSAAAHLALLVRELHGHQLVRLGRQLQHLLPCDGNGCESSR